MGVEWIKTHEDREHATLLDDPGGNDILSVVTKAWPRLPDDPSWNWLLSIEDEDGQYHTFIRETENSLDAAKSACVDTFCAFVDKLTAARDVVRGGEK